MPYRYGTWDRLCMNPEQRAIYQSKPIARMRWFASLLNWRGLQLDCAIFSDDERAQFKLPEPGIITYYETTDPRFSLLINERPEGGSNTHMAAVKAPRYGILHLAFHSFTLHDDEVLLRAEAERLRPFLDRKLFKQAANLRRLKMEPSVRLLRSCKKVRGRANKQFVRLRNERVMSAAKDQ
jgi:hypothetical protein